jgi:squalene synthase HpnC
VGLTVPGDPASEPQTSAAEEAAAIARCLPGGVPLPDGDAGRPAGLAEAQAYCRALARRHYENFLVASVLVPRELRQPMYHVYAYCRWADDLADEADNARAGLAGVRGWRRELLRCYAGEPRHPVFVALADTIREFDLPIQPFDDLLQAFEQDQTVTRYRTYDDLLDYCRYSADPVGRLVLYLFGYRDEERQRLSDCTCTALQLANFWQDVARDVDRGRVYLPLEDLERFGYSEAELLARVDNDAFRGLLCFQVERTRELFRPGEALRDMVRRPLNLQIDLFGQGGLLVLRLIEQQGYGVLSRRPAIRKRQQAGLFLRRLARHWLSI